MVLRIHLGILKFRESLSKSSELSTKSLVYLHTVRSSLHMVFVGSTLLNETFTATPTTYFFQFCAVINGRQISGLSVEFWTAKNYIFEGEVQYWNRSINIA